MLTSELSVRSWRVAKENPWARGRTQDKQEQNKFLQNFTQRKGRRNSKGLPCLQLTVIRLYKGVTDRHITLRRDTDRCNKKRVSK